MMSKDNSDLEEALTNVDAANRKLFLRVASGVVALRDYEDYYLDHKDDLTELDQALQGGDYKKYFYLHSPDWRFEALRTVLRKLRLPEGPGNLKDLDRDKCALYDGLLADTRAADLRNHRNEATDDPWTDAINAVDWSELLVYFNIHRFSTFDRSQNYLTDAEEAEWAAFPEKLVVYIGWTRDDASEFAQFWTLDYDLAERDANVRNNAEVFMTVIAKDDIRGYLNRHGRQEIILDNVDVILDALEPYERPMPDSSPLES